MEFEEQPYILKPTENYPTLVEKTIWGDIAICYAPIVVKQPSG